MYTVCLEQKIPWKLGDYTVSFIVLGVRLLCKRTPNTIKSHIYCETQINFDNIIQSFDPFLPNGWVFICRLSSCWLGSSYIHLNLKYFTCFKQGITWHSENYKKWVTIIANLTWFKATVNGPSRQVLTVQLNHLFSMCRCEIVLFFSKFIGFGLSPVYAV